MPDLWRDYQEEVAQFFRSLGFSATVGQSVQGVRSKHEIDVLVTFERWGMVNTWIVECKLHARPVTKAVVETLKSIAAEVGASVAFLVAESKFQSGAIDAAQKTNVVLSSLGDLRANSRDDVLREAIGALQFRVLQAKDKLISYIRHVAERGGGENPYSLLGRAEIVSLTMDNARLGKLPVTFPGDSEGGADATTHCSTLEEVVVEASRRLDLIESEMAE